MRRTHPNIPAFLLAAVAAAGSWSTAGHAADPARGEQLHQVCLDCHGTDVYKPPKAKVKSLTELRKEVARWNDHYNPPMNKQEIDDVVAYLNREFYKF